MEAAVSAATRWICRRHACHYSSTPSRDGMESCRRAGAITKGQTRECSRRLSRRCFHDALRTTRFTVVANRISKKGPPAVEHAIHLQGKRLWREEFSGPSGR